MLGDRDCILINSVFPEPIARIFHSTASERHRYMNNEDSAEGSVCTFTAVDTLTTMQGKTFTSLPL